MSTSINGVNMNDAVFAALAKDSFIVSPSGKLYRVSDRMSDSFVFITARRYGYDHGAPKILRRSAARRWSLAGGN